MIDVMDEMHHLGQPLTEREAAEADAVAEGNPEGFQLIPSPYQTSSSRERTNDPSGLRHRSITQRADGTWRGRVDLGRAPDGSRRRASVTRRSRREVRQGIVEPLRREAGFGVNHPSGSAQGHSSTNGLRRPRRPAFGRARWLDTGPLPNAISSWRIVATTPA